MQPGETIYPTIFRRTAAGLPAAGLTLADFGLDAYLDGAVASVSPAITEIGAAGDAQAYKLALTLPGTKGLLALRPRAASGTDQVWPEVQVEIENNDIDALYAVQVVPIVSIVSLGGPQGDIALRVVNGDYAPVSFTVKDQAGAVINLSGYTLPHFRVWDKAQAATAYDQTTGITMTTGGLVTIGIPKTASFYSLLTPAGTDSVTLYWQFIANEAGDATKPRTLARGTIAVVRKES